MLAINSIPCLKSNFSHEEWGSQGIIFLQLWFTDYPPVLRWNNVPFSRCVWDDELETANSYPRSLWSCRLLCLYFWNISIVMQIWFSIKTRLGVGIAPYKKVLQEVSLTLTFLFPEGSFFFSHVLHETMKLANSISADLFLSSFRSYFHFKWLSPPPLAPRQSKHIYLYVCPRTIFKITW